jgi:alpha/beta superfamily hydrolase
MNLDLIARIIQDMKKLLLCILTFVLTSTNYAQVIPVDQNRSSFFISSIPTQTLYWQGANSKALIVFIPGGDGNLGLKPDTTDRKYSFYQTLKSLTNPDLTSGKFDLVLLDFPFPMRDVVARGTDDHLVRVESVIQYYHAKTGLPVWIMGHSNGGISLTNFIQYLQKNNKTDEIAGVIASALRNGSNFNAPVDFPILFLHHEKDACLNTTSAYSLRLYEKVKEFTKLDIQYTWIKNGESESNDPCRSGFHMYYNSGTEASKVIDEFITRNLNYARPN